MFKFNSKEEKFFTKLNEQMNITLEGVKVLDKFTCNLETPDLYVQAIQKLEHDADTIVHNILDELNNTFVTPLDRDDIYLISRKMDNILDNIYSILHKFIMFDIKNLRDEVSIFILFLTNAIEDLVILVENLETLNKADSQKIINQKAININKIENEADIFYRETISKLFKNKNLDPLEIIKWKEVYQNFENSIDSCENVTNIIRGVVMKHA